MKRLLGTIAIFVLALVGCRPSTDQIGEQVKILLQQKIDKQPELKKYHLIVSKVDVIREEGNKYQGLANVVMNGEVHDVPVEILADDSEIMYKTDSTAFLFVEQEALKDAIDGVQQSVKDALAQISRPGQPDTPDERAAPNPGLLNPGPPDHGEADPADLAAPQVKHHQAPIVDGPAYLASKNSAPESALLTAPAGSKAEDFGSRFGWYVDLVKKKVAQSWYLQEIDPNTPAGLTVFVQFTVARDGSPGNISLATPSSSPSLDSSCLHAVQRVDSFGLLPSGFNESELKVLYHCTYPGTIPTRATTQTALHHVGGAVTAPQLIYSPDPEFSDEARREKFQGVSVVSLIVDEQGNPQRIATVRHIDHGLDEKAIEAVRQYKFKPAMLQGKPVPVEVNIEVNFKIY